MTSLEQAINDLKEYREKHLQTLIDAKCLGYIEDGLADLIWGLPQKEKEEDFIEEDEDEEKSDYDEHNINSHAHLGIKTWR